MDLSINRMKAVGFAGLGATACIFALATITNLNLVGLLIMAPFGASMVIVFALPESPLAQPRNVFFGHVIAAAIGLAMLHFVGVSAFSMALAVGLAVMAMMLADSVHPPAGANPLLIMMTAQPWEFLLHPVAAGAAFIVLFAWCYHRFVSGTPYPKRWI